QKEEMAALDALRRYVLLVERDASGLVLAADTYLTMGRYDEALEVALRAREIRFHERTQRILGLVYLHKGDNEKAIFHLSKADADAVVLNGLLTASMNANKLDDLDTLIDKAARLKEPTPALKRSADAAKALLSRRKALNELVKVPKDKASEYAA